MKKLISVFVCIAMLFSLCIFANALESQDKFTPAPEITGFSENKSSGSTSYNISFTHSVDEAEQMREFIYSIALEEHGSLEALKNSKEAYLMAKTRLYCEISPDNINFYTLKEISDSSFNISMSDEIIPLLTEKGFSPSYETGFTFYVRLLMASENFNEKNVSLVYVYTPSQSMPMYILPDETFIPHGTPLKLSQPLEEDLVLPYPVRTGYIFDGWSEGSDATRIRIIEKGTTQINLTAHWIPHTYEINYVLTTNITFPFGRPDNSDNPDSYTVGTAQKIFAISSPVITHVFDGWYYNPEFTGEKVTEIAAGETGDKKLYAKWLSYEDIANAQRQEREQFIKEKKYGDIDDDGKISAADARLLLRAVVGLEKLSYETLKRADYLNNNKISSLNARITLRISVGLDSLYDILLENGVLP